jgi:hypothetical protein
MTKLNQVKSGLFQKDVIIFLTNGGPCETAKIPASAGCQIGWL